MGSISHTQGSCVVVASLCRHARALGIDVEQGSSLDEPLVSFVCTGSEMAWLRTQPERDRLCLAKLVFSAKEAFYKCQYPLTQTMLDFLDISVEVDVSKRSFVMRPLKDGVLPASVWQSTRGQWLRTAEFVVAAAAIAP